VAQVVEAAQRLDTGSLLGRLPVAAAEAAEVDPAAARVREGFGAPVNLSALPGANGDEFRRGFQSVSTHPINRTRGEHQ
jgi:hypothetical protein